MSITQIGHQLMSFYIIETSKKEAIEMDRVSHLHNVPKHVLGRSTYLHTDLKARGSYSDHDGGENYIRIILELYILDSTGLSRQC